MWVVPVAGFVRLVAIPFVQQRMSPLLDIVRVQGRQQQPTSSCAGVECCVKAYATFTKLSATAYCSVVGLFRITQTTAAAAAEV